MRAGTARTVRSYRRLPSLRDYLLIAHDERLVEHFARNTDGRLWTLRDVREGAVQLASIGCALPLDEIQLKAAPAIG